MDKLDEIIKNQEILNRNQIAIYELLICMEVKLYRSTEKEFLLNYLADLVGTATIGLIDISNDIKHNNI